MNSPRYQLFIEYGGKISREFDRLSNEHNILDKDKNPVERQRIIDAHIKPLVEEFKKRIEILTTTTGIQITSKWEFVTPEVATGVVALLESCDYYLAHPSQRPKTDIADYVESQGFLVPRRYKNIDEALVSSKDFIMRSEHPQDYDGVSWLFESMVFYASMWNVEQEEVQNQQSQILALEKVKEYCKHTWKNYEKFISKASFEYWEYIEWENLTLVRDEAVEWRYHIFINDKSWSDYICYDSGSTIQWEIPENIWVWNIKRLIEQYEKISRLPRFDTLQCPNIEFQLWDDGNIYFLQYKRGHQKELHKWTLERELEEWEVEADFVRGSTKQWGEEFELKQYWIYPYLIPKEQDILNDYDLLFNLKLQICIDIQTWKKINLWFHGIVSEILQSWIYWVISYEIFSALPVVMLWYKLRILEWIRNHVHNKNDKLFRDWAIKVRIYSDGKKAIVKFLISTEDLIQIWLNAWYSREEMDRDINESFEEARDK